MGGVQGRGRGLPPHLASAQAPAVPTFLTGCGPVGKQQRGPGVDPQGLQQVSGGASLGVGPAATALSTCSPAPTYWESQRRHAGAAEDSGSNPGHPRAVCPGAQRWAS